jgi:para-nitrobenzyl esterase
MKKFHCLLSIFLITASAGAQIKTGADVAVVPTESGRVRGYVHNGIYTYKGIPYAEAKRFEAARKPEPWTEIRSSLTYGPVSPLIDPVTHVHDESEFVFNHSWGYTNEDCMRVNVWTPGVNDGKKRPVMFWIHGGGYTAGSSQELPSYDGENLAKKGDVVVVSINHRLNITGFLDLSAYGEKYKYSANNSILDLRIALEWVRDNIANFGGDVNNVTIFGQSGGGAKVNTLMAMPSAKGLFHKAINQSGSARLMMLDKATTQRISAEVLKALNIPPSKIDTLQSIPYADLAAAGKKAIAAVEMQLKSEGKQLPGGNLSWGPSVDGDLFPHQLFSKEAFDLSKDIPLLIGTVKNEFMPSLSSNMLRASASEVDDYLKKTFGEKAEAYKSAVKKAYPNDTRPSDLIDIDTRFRPGAVFQAREKSSLNAAPVFMYLFTWQSPVMDGKYKAMHCMELPFCFNNIARCEEMTGGGKDAYILADRMSSSWIAFAKTGNPGHKGLPEWPAFNVKTTLTMHFDNTCVVKPQLDAELFSIVKK